MDQLEVNLGGARPRAGVLVDYQAGRERLLAWGEFSYDSGFNGPARITPASPNTLLGRLLEAWPIPLALNWG